LVESLERDLRINPPQKFDVARALRVFSSKVQYVELEVMNYRLGSRQVQLPPELLDIEDDELRRRISSRIRAPLGELTEFKMTFPTAKGPKDVPIDERWLTKERKRIEDHYTFPIPRFGRVILSSLRKDFDEEIARYKNVIIAYQKAVVDQLETIKGKFEQTLVDEYLPRWANKPPERLTRYTPAPAKADIEDYLRGIARKVFADAVNFDPPHVRVVYKNIAPESVGDARFLEPLKAIMERRDVPVKIIASLFMSGDAAPAPSKLTVT
jgi:hypothetical protein